MRFAPLRTARVKAGFRVAEIAQAAGRSLGWVYALERGLVTPSRMDAEAIAKLLRVKPEDLFSSIREA